MAKQDTCPRPIPDRFGLSPTFQLCGCDDGPCSDSGGCKCGSGPCTCGCIDLKVDQYGRLSCANAVTHHALVRLGLKARALDGDNVNPKCEDRGGWWAQSVLDDQIVGNRLWTLDGETVSANTERGIDLQRRAEDMISESLADLVDDGVIADVDIEGDLDACKGELCISDIKITQDCEHPKRDFWQFLWNTEGGYGC